MGGWLAGALLCCLTVTTGCAQERDDLAPSPTPGDQPPSLAERSQDTLDLHASTDGPGCSAAVARRGEVVWRGVQGFADVKARTPITTDTVFDIGSVSKQFTAAAILLLRDTGKLQLDDALSDHLPGFPRWAKGTTLAHLMHHTSGVPGYEELLQKQGSAFTDRATQRQALAALADVRKLDFTPGSDWAYTNSNYVLLAEVVRVASGQDLPQFLKVHVFDPLDLDMVVEPNAPVPGKAVSYRGDTAPFEAVDHQWEQVGDGAIQTTPTQLVRWADNYRTGKVGGARWRAAVIKDAARVPPDASGVATRYGAGIYLTEDGGLGHGGGWEGFVSGFWVSPDRVTSLAVACNKVFDPGDLVKSLISIWSPS